jgi:hypothetical protein
MGTGIYRFEYLLAFSMEEKEAIYIATITLV